MNKSTATSPDYVGFVWNSVYPKRTLWFLIIFHWHHHFFEVFSSFSRFQTPFFSIDFHWFPRDFHGEFRSRSPANPNHPHSAQRPDTEYWEMALNATKADFPFDTWRANLSGTVPKFSHLFLRNPWNFLVFKFSWLPLFFGHVHEISGF